MIDNLRGIKKLYRYLIVRIFILFFLFTNSIFAANLEKINLDVKNKKWFNTGIKLSKDDEILIDWDTSKVGYKPHKYLILYRIDPRFLLPQVFIQTLNENGSDYNSSFHDFEKNSLVNFQNNPNLFFLGRSFKTRRPL